MPVHQAVVKTAQQRLQASSQVASVNPPPAPLPTLDPRGVIVLTEVTTTFQTPSRVVPAVSPDQWTARPAVIRATYAILPTPNGWLIIQI